MLRSTRSRLTVAVLTGLLLSVPAYSALAQFGGSRAGLEEHPKTGGTFAPLTREVAESFIAIDGKAEVRVKPTELRIVMAVTAEGETAQDCQKTVEATLNKLKPAWAKLKIAPEAIVVDFIAVLPRYEWKTEKRGEVEVGVEKKAGYRLQTNVHLAVANEAAAQAALGAAFEQGVTDIIAFDYWSKELDTIKEQARDKALVAARAKADVLLAMFAQKPPVINVQEQTTVHYPESLYHSFTNVAEQQVVPAWRRDLTLIQAYRPRNTYYRGFYSDGDVQPRDLPMKPEISVVATVRLYFESPATAKRVKKEAKE